MMVQSSSATLAITISAASQGLIEFPTAAALVLGENIGTTITAYLASLGATTNARRAAYFHIIFNIVGVFWITLIFHWYIQGIQAGVEWFQGKPIHTAEVKDGIEKLPGIEAGIATTHSIFNIVNTLMFLPFVSFFSGMLVKLVPDKGYKEKPKLTDLEIRLLETPVIAIEQSRVEILKMATGCTKMLDWLQALQAADEPDKLLIDRLVRREQVLDNIQDEVAEFVTTLLSRNVPHSVADEGRRQLQMADEYESISDYVLSIWKHSQRLRKAGEWYSPGQLQKFEALHAQVAEYVRRVNQAYQDQNETVATKLAPFTKDVKRTVKKLRKEHLEELTAEKVAPAVNVALLGTLNAYSRVRDHAESVAELVGSE
jgi:phosphate:Na+ symporter